MMVFPKSLEQLINNLQALPSVGQKTAERYALHLLEMDEEEVRELAAAMVSARNNIGYCKNCGNLSEEKLCSICLDENRSQEIIYVVENVTDVIAMEKTENFNGQYHVLKGLISPSKGILPDDINIESLKKRLENPKLKEVVIATNLTIEGDTTSLYLSKIIDQISNNRIVVSRIAHGLPVGGHLNYADDLTIIKAMEGRIKI